MYNQIIEALNFYDSTVIKMQAIMRKAEVLLDT